MSFEENTIYKYYPLNHSLNQLMINRFIDESDISVRDIIKKLIKNTIHISFETFIITFKDLIRKFEGYIKTSRLSIKDKKSKNRPIFIFIDKLNKNYKEKSNYWLYILFKSYCINFEIITISSFIDERIRTNDYIIFLDDCIYSGTQMSNTINFNSMIFTDNKLKLNICVLVPFITEMGKLTIERGMRLNTTLDECTFKLFYNKLIKENTSDILTTDEISRIDNFYNKYEIFKDRYLIYFDHKLADNVSTIPLFYSGLVPCNYNRNLLMKTSFGIKDVEKLIYIPLINNCDKIRNFNSLVPECPFPMYKQRGFTKLMSTINAKRSNKKALSLDMMINIKKRTGKTYKTLN